MTKVVHGSGWVSFGPSLDLTHQRRVGGKGTWNWPPTSIGQIGFMFKSVRLVERVAKAANVIEIFKKFTKIYKNSLDLHWKSPKSTWIWPNLAKSHQIWSRSHWISSNLSLILPELAKFVYNIGQVGWIGFWRRKPTTRPANIRSWVSKPVTNQRKH